jgi:hypothetical protein
MWGRRASGFSGRDKTILNIWSRRRVRPCRGARGVRQLEQPRLRGAGGAGEEQRRRRAHPPRRHPGSPLPWKLAPFYASFEVAEVG